MSSNPSYLRDLAVGVDRFLETVEEVMASTEDSLDPVLQELLTYLETKLQDADQAISEFTANFITPDETTKDAS